MFEDDLTRELPSALRTFTDLPPVTSASADEIVELADDDVLAIVEHTVVIPRPLSVPPLTADVRRDVRRAPEPNAGAGSLVLLLGGGLLVACVVAGAIGVAAGHTRSAGPSDAQASGDRRPRVAVVAGAREVVTIPTLSAPEKATDFEPEPGPQPAVVPVPLPARSRHVARPRTATLSATAPTAPLSASGFGHLGSDRR